MDVREKLVELLGNSFEKQSEKRGLLTAPHTADDLIANGVTVQEWISVDDRLPSKQHDWVLVACKLVPEGWHGVPHIAELRNGVWWANCYDAPLAEEGIEVTHWMPLPEPPDMRGAAHDS